MFRSMRIVVPQPDATPTTAAFSSIRAFSLRTEKDYHASHHARLASQEDYQALLWDTSGDREFLIPTPFGSDQKLATNRQSDEVRLRLGVDASSSLFAGWENPQPPSLPYYHYLEFHHARLSQQDVSLDSIKARLKTRFGSLSLQAVYKDSPMLAHLNTLRGDCSLTVSVLNDAKAQEYVVEVQRRAGDSRTFGIVARQIIEAVQRGDVEVEGGDGTDAACAADLNLLPSMQQQQMMKRLNQFLERLPRDDDSPSTETTGAVTTDATTKKKQQLLDNHESSWILSRVAQQLQSPLLQERTIGFETLVNLTDWNKTIRPTALLASRALLLGGRGGDCRLIHNLVLDMVFRSSSLATTDTATASAYPQQEVDTDASSSELNHSLLALAALSNALQVLETTEELEQFVHVTCDQERQVDPIRFLLLETTSPNLGRSYYALLALKAIFEKVPSLRPSLLQHVPVIESARSVGVRVPHSAVEQASQKLLEVIRAAGGL